MDPEFRDRVRMQLQATEPLFERREWSMVDLYVWWLSVQSSIVHDGAGTGSGLWRLVKIAASDLYGESAAA